MSCLKGKDKCGKKRATHRCKKCGALSESSKNLCKPQKIKNKDANKDSGKDKKK